jgi:membrane fusion protein, multidrug efflux system
LHSTADNKAEMRNLKVGLIGDGQAVIEAGLKAGERVVTSGHYRVVPGGSVEVLADREEQTTADRQPASKGDQP